MSRGYDPLYGGGQLHVKKLLNIPAMMNTQIHYLIKKKSIPYVIYVRQAIQEKIERDAQTYPEVLHLEPVPAKKGK